MQRTMIHLGVVNFLTIAFVVVVLWAVSGGVVSIFRQGASAT